MVSPGDNVEITEHNDAVTRINLILGIGSGDKGYGQNMSNTGTASAGGVDDITAGQWGGLFTDLNTVYGHQFNTSIGINQIVAGNIIGADESNIGSGDTVQRTPGTPDTFTVVNPDATKGVNDIPPLIPAIEVDHLTVHATQTVLETKVQPSDAGASYTSDWPVAGLSAELKLSFTAGYICKNDDGTDVTATTQDHRRHFFNTGGVINMSADFVNESTEQKDVDWNAIITNSGTTSFKVHSTTTTASGSFTVASAIGFHELTSTFQEIFSKSGSAPNYAENNFKIKAKLDSTDAIVFRFEWNDADTDGTNADDKVTGDLELTVTQVRASGSSGVTVITPGYSFIQNIA